MKLTFTGKWQIFSAKFLFDLFLPNYEYQPNFAWGQRVIHCVPVPRVGKSGVAAAKRAARKRRNRKK
ncbi:hypothetical protein [Alysiella crassa]|uniref:Uncharacterized protein n=1 Tax=Alysiella crassa TaxID=153491 RepID=A0A376BWC8_9NEIS|nr:hypothetical protein [Alysiella crassa]UOP06181.1 hypothetical protein LVJ80_10145 [Alysiella crassa]SSY80654.1 Uncharacterised protein [Alysiella crassa]